MADVETAYGEILKERQVDELCDWRLDRTLLIRRGGPEEEDEAVSKLYYYEVGIYLLFDKQERIVGFGMYAGTGRLEMAESLYQKTLEGYEETVGGEHPHTLHCLHGLASIMARLRRRDEAETIYKRTLDLRRRVLGAEHPRTLETQGALATLYFSARRYREADF